MHVFVHSIAMKPEQEEMIHSLQNLIGQNLKPVPEGGQLVQTASATTTHSTYYVWSPQEEEHLMKRVHKFGKNWKLIQETYFPNLNPMQLKNKYYFVRRRATKEFESSGVSNSNVEGSSQSNFDKTYSEKSVTEYDNVLDTLKEII